MWYTEGVQIRILVQTLFHIWMHSGRPCYIWAQRRLAYTSKKYQYEKEKSEDRELSDRFIKLSTNKNSLQLDRHYRIHFTSYKVNYSVLFVFFNLLILLPTKFHRYVAGQIYQVIAQGKHKLSHLLPARSQQNYHLRSTREFAVPVCKTNRYRDSFIISHCT